MIIPDHVFVLWSVFSQLMAAVKIPFLAGCVVSAARTGVLNQIMYEERKKLWSIQAGETNGRQIAI